MIGAKPLVIALSVATAACATEPGISRDGRQIAHFNHAFATVDPETAQAIKDSAFLRRFANFEVRTTTGTRATWTGRYLYGRTTYVEFFAPSDFAINDRPAPVGSWGIAVSGDRPGSNAALKARLEAYGHKALIEMDTRQFGDRKVLWFEALTAISEHGDSGALGETVSLWAMEYQPSYLDLPEVAKEPPEGPHDVISRERYQSDAYADRMMRDITDVHVALSRADYARIEPLLRAAGFSIRRSGRDMLADGQETDIRLSVGATQAPVLRQLRFMLNSPAKRHVETIGRSKLVVGPGASAVWTFE